MEKFEVDDGYLGYPTTVQVSQNEFSPNVWLALKTGTDFLNACLEPEDARRLACEILKRSL